MPTRALPDWVVSSLTRLGTISEEECQVIVAALAGGAPTLSTSSIAESVAENSVLGAEDVDMLLNALIGLAGMGYARDLSGDRLAREVAASPDLMKTDIDTETLVDRIARLLDVASLRLLGKAHDLSSEHARIFLDARIITDIRPIFGSEPDAQPEGAFFCHTLKLELIRDQGDVEHVYLVLDEHDLDTLSSLIRRAKQKADSLRSVLGRVEITHAGIEG